MAAANMAGEILPMFVIGKAAKPRCFKNIEQLPCRYRSQKNSWMNAELFGEWIRYPDRKFEAIVQLTGYWWFGTNPVLQLHICNRWIKR